MIDAAVGRGTPAGRRRIRLGPLQLLAGVADGERACAEPFGLWLVAHPQGRQIPAEHRGDVLHDVLVNFLARAESIVGSVVTGRPGARSRDPDRRLHAYVGRAIANRYRSVQRARRRHVSLGRLDRLSLDPAMRGAMSSLDDTGSALDRGLEVLERVEQRVVSRAPRPADARRTLDELRDLALGHRRMAEVVAVELGAAGGGDDPVRARNRLYLRHRRMRQALHDGVMQLRRAGELDEADATLAEWIVDGLLKRRA
jgi:hypothetical protein